MRCGASGERGSLNTLLAAATLGLTSLRFLSSQFPNSVALGSLIYRAFASYSALSVIYDAASVPVPVSLLLLLLILLLLLLLPSIFELLLFVPSCRDRRSRFSVFFSIERIIVETIVVPRKKKERKEDWRKKKKKEKQFNVLNRLIETFTVRATHPREKLEVLSRGENRGSRGNSGYIPCII